MKFAVRMYSNHKICPLCHSSPIPNQEITIILIKNSHPIYPRYNNYVGGNCGHGRVIVNIIIIII